MVYSFSQYLAAAQAVSDRTIIEAVSRIDAAKKLARSWRMLAARLEQDHEPSFHPGVQVYDDCAAALEKSISRGAPTADTNKLAKTWYAAAVKAMDEDEREAYESCAASLSSLPRP